MDMPTMINVSATKKYCTYFVTKVVYIVEDIAHYVVDMIVQLSY